MTQSIDLIYTSRLTTINTTSQFFKNFQSISSTIYDFKKNSALHEITPADEVEISRAKSYAVFPELSSLVDSGKKNSVKEFIACLEKRGIREKAFQNKILSLILQNKCGIQFGLASIFVNILHENNAFFSLNHNYSVILDVKTSKKVVLTFKGIVCDTDKIEDCLGLNIQVIITPSQVSIKHFKVTQLNEDNERSAYVFGVLKDNQASIWQKILIFLKNFFGCNHDLDLENDTKDMTPWEPCL